MQPSIKLVAIALLSMSILIACFIKPSHCQSGSFSSTRPSTNVLFEPTLSFIRQNLRLVNSYVALLRSIFVGAYERPLITSTDSPNQIKNPPPRVPPMDLPSLMAAARHN